MITKQAEFASLDDAQAFAAKINTAKKLPCCNCYVKEDSQCACDQHRTPDGRDDRPHGRSCAIGYFAIVAHPTDPTKFAYPVDDEVERLASDKAVAADLQTAISANVARAVVKTADWQPIIAIAVAKAVDVPVDAIAVEASPPIKLAKTKAKKQKVAKK